MIIEPLNLEMANVGSADVVSVSVKPLISPSLNHRNVKLISTESEEWIGKIFREKTKINPLRLIVSGKGHALITFQVEYTDTIGNRYSDSLSQLFY
jgi:hypothetical protein